MKWNLIYKISIVVWVITIVFGLWFTLYKNIEKKIKIEIDTAPVTYDLDLIKAHLLQLNEIELSKTENEIEEEPYFPISDTERWIIECIVAGESKYEPLLGKMAVAQCIMNAMVKDDLTAFQVKIEYQYSGWDDKLETNDLEEWKEVCHAVWCVFDNGEKVTQENILWFYNPSKSVGKFHNTQKFVTEIGHHRFYAPWEDD